MDKIKTDIYKPQINNFRGKNLSCVRFASIFEHFIVRGTGSQSIRPYSPLAEAYNVGYIRGCKGNPWHALFRRLAVYSSNTCFFLLVSHWEWYLAALISFDRVDAFQWRCESKSAICCCCDVLITPAFKLQWTASPNIHRRIMRERG